MLAMAPLVLALAAVGVVSGLVARALARQPGLILADNYRSVLAAQRMKEAVERVDQSVLLELLGQSRDAAGLDQHVAQFEHELAAEAENITEAGEQEAVDEVRAGWSDYKQVRARVERTDDDDDRLALYSGDLSHAFAQVKRGTDEILDINQDAMVRKSQRTERRAMGFEHSLTLAVVLASILGLFASVSLTRRLLRPLGVVSAAVRRFGQGDTQVRARVHGANDIAQLAQEFNTMADRLERYRKSSLGELIQAQQAAQAAIDSLPDPVVMLDATGALQGCNQAAATLLRLDAKGTGSLSFDEVDPAVRSLVDRLRAHVLGGRGAYSPKGFEDSLRVTTPEGERIYLPRATPLYGESGNVAGTALVLQDVTRLFRFDELKNNLVATVAHEFRTPLTSLHMAIHLCTEETVGPLNPKQADLLFAAREDCQRLQTIVDDLLNLSRIEAGRIDLHKRRVDPDSLVSLAVDVHRSAAEQRKLTLRTEIDPGLPEVFADPDRLQLVFTNLLTNAIRYSQPGGEIVIRARAEDESTGQAGSALLKTNLIRFEVVDNGPGVPVEHQSGLFEKFFRVPGSPAGGAGLGLFIARGIVQAHDGRIGITSEAGKGATFWFTIPAAPEQPSSAQA
jgi:signal transduction histidine kinase